MIQWSAEICTREQDVQSTDNKTIHRSAHFFLSSISYNIIVTIYRPTPAMASIEDLIATISGGLHAGQQGNDIRDLHVSFSRRLPTLPQLPNFFTTFPRIPIYPSATHTLQKQRPLTPHRYFYYRPN